MAISSVHYKKFKTTNSLIRNNPPLQTWWQTFNKICYETEVKLMCLQETKKQSANFELSHSQQFNPDDN